MSKVEWIETPIPWGWGEGFILAEGTMLTGRILRSIEGVVKVEARSDVKRVGDPAMSARGVDARTPLAYAAPDRSTSEALKIRLRQATGPKY